MGHQLYEKYIFQYNQLSKQESEILAEHLKHCEQCTRLQTTWQKVDRELRSSSMVAPAPDFVSRWQAYVLMKRSVQHEVQAIKTFAIIGSTILMLTGALVVWLLFNYSIPELIVQGVSLFSNLLQAFFNFRAMMAQFLRNAPPFTPYLMWIMVAGWGILLGSLWGLTIWRITRQGVSNK